MRAIENTNYYQSISYSPILNTLHLYVASRKLDYNFRILCNDLKYQFTSFNSNNRAKDLLQGVLEKTTILPK